MSRTVASWIRNLTFASCAMVAAAGARAEEAARPAASVEAKLNELDGKVKALECGIKEDPSRHQYDWVLWGAFGVAGVAFAGAWQRKSVSDNKLARQKADADTVAAMWKSLVEGNDLTSPPAQALAHELLAMMRAPPGDPNKKPEERRG